MSLEQYPILVEWSPAQRWRVVVPDWMEVAPFFMDSVSSAIDKAVEKIEEAAKKRYEADMPMPRPSKTHRVLISMPGTKGATHYSKED